MNKIIVISATSKSQREFWGENSAPLTTFLGQRSMQFHDSHIVYDNTDGLGAVYNRYIDKYAELDEDVILVFVHDDVMIEDINFYRKLNASSFDIVGLAGASEFKIEAPALWHRAGAGKISGAVAHTKDPFTRGESDIWMSSFGPFRQRCVVMDGLFLAVRVSALKKTGVRFDPSFGFHFYDLDFCLQCHEAGLSLGTEPIWVVHSSLGEYDKSGWLVDQERFINKWGMGGVGLIEVSV